MIDLIERQAAIELIHSLYPSAPIMRRNRERWKEKYTPYIEVEKALEQLPLAEPKIVRCKDCKFYSLMNKETKTGICNLTMHQNFGDDWFCAGAERRTDATD